MLITTEICFDKQNQSIEQGSPTLDLEIHCPAEFSTNPNQTHLNKLIKIFRITTNSQAVRS